jgi:predicted Zn-dependent protease
MRGPGLFFLFIPLLSCAPGARNDDALLVYIRASEAYRENRFDETAALLGAPGNFPPALALRGKAEFFRGNIPEAEKYLRRALALRPGGADVSLFLARLLRERGEAGEAEALTGAVLEQDPWNLRALRFAAELARDRGPSGEASSSALLDRAAEAAAEAALVFLDRARARWIAGKGSAALEDLSRARFLLGEHSPLLRPVEHLEERIAASVGREE